MAHLLELPPFVCMPVQTGSFDIIAQMATDCSVHFILPFIDRKHPL